MVGGPDLLGVLNASQPEVDSDDSEGVAVEQVTGTLSSNPNVVEPLSVPCKPLKLISAVETRWWARYRSCRRLLQLQTAVTLLLGEGVEGMAIPTAQQWDVFACLVDVMGPYADISYALESEQITAPYCLQFIVKLLNVGSKRWLVSPKYSGRTE